MKGSTYHGWSAKNEATFYVPAKLSTAENSTSFWHTLFPDFSAGELSVINELYPGPAIDDNSICIETRDMRITGIRSQYKLVRAAYGYCAYTCPVRTTNISPREKSFLSIFSIRL
jgi:hypothetical protein